MKVLFASVEVSPFAWTGGMGDVAGSLPKALRALGVDMRIIMPRHRGAAERAPDLRRVVESCPVHMPWWVSGCAIDESHLPGADVPVYLVEHDQYFDREGIFGPPGGAWGDNLERFAFFCRAVIESLAGLQWRPDIIHLNDWHTALIALYRAQWGLDFSTVYTAHQFGPAFHGTFPADNQALAGIDLGRREARSFVRGGQIDLARAGLALADMVNTVSERYAHEVARPDTEEDVWDLIAAREARFRGIINGIDYEVWNPARDEGIAARYGAEDPAGKRRCKADLQRLVGLPPDPSVPLVAMISRLDALKGFDLVLEALPLMGGMQFACLGSGDPGYAAALQMAARSRDDVAAIIQFDADLARKFYAGADIFLMPSRREPAGLAQMIALAYGAIPVVHKTGGLADTISEDPEGQNGFVFEEYDVEALLAALGRALEMYRDQAAWERLVAYGMRCDFSWDRSARRYLEMYEETLALGR